MSMGNPMPAKTLEFLADRSMPAVLEVERDGPVLRFYDQEYVIEEEPAARRSWWLLGAWIVLGGACVYALREGWIAAAFILLVPAVLVFMAWCVSDADGAGRQLHLDFDKCEATLIVGRGRRKHRRTWRGSIDDVRLVLCRVKGFCGGDKGHEIPTFDGVGVFAVVPGERGGGKPGEPGWIMLSGGYDYRKLLADLKERVPEFADPEQYWEPIRGQLDRML